MKKVCVVTSTRAEYGLLASLIKEMEKDAFFDVRVVVTGAHLESEFGSTVKAIECDGIQPDAKLPILDGTENTGKAMGKALVVFSDYFTQTEPDMVVLLGDRYETFAVAAAAVIHRVPIAHIHGGELTEGAYDDCFRHCITKMSMLHFPCCREYRERIIQMGEAPESVFDVGALGVENIKKIQIIEKCELERELDFCLDLPYAIVTYHPVTLGNRKAVDDLQEVLSAIEQKKDMKFIITKANADDGGREINRLLDDFAKKNRSKIYLCANLGQKLYFNAIRYCEFVMGNSSSGILEVPSFRKPTINIGERQKGRIQATSVLNCKPFEQDIQTAMDLAMSEDIKRICRETVNPFEKEHTAKTISKTIRSYLLEHPKMRQKTFFDLFPKRESI